MLSEAILESNCVYIHGIKLDMDTSIQWLAANACFQDHFKLIYHHLSNHWSLNRLFLLVAEEEWGEDGWTRDTLRGV